MPIPIESTGSRCFSSAPIQSSWNWACSVAFYDVFKRADRVLVPSAPAVIEMQEAIPVFKAARAAKLDVTVALVRATPAQSGRTRFWIDKYGEKGLVAPYVLTELVGCPDAYALGEGVTEMAPGGPAALEVVAFLGYLLHRPRGDNHDL